MTRNTSLILFHFLFQAVKCPGPYVLHCSGGGYEPSPGSAGSDGGEGQELVWHPSLGAPLRISKLALSVLPFQVTTGTAAQGEKPTPPQPSASGHDHVSVFNTLNI